MTEYWCGCYTPADEMWDFNSASALERAKDICRAFARQYEQTAWLIQMTQGEPPEVLGSFILAKLSGKAEPFVEIVE